MKLGGCSLKVAITCSRSWRDADAVDSQLAELPRDALVIAGGETDRLAAFFARRHGLRFLEVPADWHGDGEQAGILRNHRMLDMLDPDDGDYVIAFDNGTDDTTHCVEQARKRGIPVRVVWSWVGGNRPESV